VQQQESHKNGVSASCKTSSRKALWLIRGLLLFLINKGVTGAKPVTSIYYLKLLMPINTYYFLDSKIEEVRRLQWFLVGFTVTLTVLVVVNREFERKRS
jgi:hypothetical protein